MDIEFTDFTSPGTSELAKLTVSVDIDFKNLGVNKSRIKLGSGAKIDKFQELLVICILFIKLYFSICGANEFRNISEKRGRRSQHIEPEQTLELHQDPEEKSC